jgi:hypothetical protein
MRYSNKLYATALIIWHSLFSGRKGAASFPPPLNGSRTCIPPESVAAAIANITSLLRPDGTLELHFEGALFPAGPFLLYRLKSCGFSGCRAAVTPQGILLTAMR